MKSDGYLLSNKHINYEFSDIVLFPNPANDFVELQLSNLNNSKNIVIDIYNISGEEVKKQICKSENVRINLDGLNDGIYLIKLITEDKVTVKKLIIQHK